MYFMKKLFEMRLLREESAISKKMRVPIKGAYRDKFLSLGSKLLQD